MRILAVLLIVLVCAAAVPVPQFVPRPLFVPRPAALPAPALVRATAGPLLNNGFSDARSVPPQSAGVGSAAGMTAVSTPGHWETRTVACGPFGQQRANGRFTKEIQVWVDGPLEKTKQQPASDEGKHPGARPTARPTGDGLLPAAASCPGGVCPGYR